MEKLIALTNEYKASCAAIEEISEDMAPHHYAAARAAIDLRYLQDVHAHLIPESAIPASFAVTAHTFALHVDSNEAKTRPQFFIIDAANNIQRAA